MKITRCSGADVHFFDGDKYQVCPVCGKPSVESVGGVAPTPTPVAQPQQENKSADAGKHKGLFGLGKKKDKPAEPQYVPVAPVLDSNEGGTIAMTEVVAGQSINNEFATAAAVSTPQPAPAPQPVPVPQPAPQPVPVSQPVVAPVQTPVQEPKVSTISQMVPQVPPMPEPQPVPQSAPQPVVQPQVNSADYDSAKTVGVYADANTEPVVGWLICVKGESFGESFNLKAGKNSIGRGAGMDVMLAQERSVSRDKHAIITYEPKKRIFLIQPGESSGLVYLNDDLLMNFAQLSAYDTIQLGEAIFKFLPFCGENFIWDDYLEK